LAELQKTHGGQPLFEAAFNFVHFHVYEGVAGRDDAQVLGGRAAWGTNFTMQATFNVAPSAERIDLLLDYDPAELCEQQVQLIGGHYAAALAAITADPQARYEAQTLLAPEERQTLARWHAGPDLPLVDACLHTLFEDQAARRPNATALVFEEQRLTYRDLNRHA